MSRIIITLKIFLLLLFGFAGSVLGQDFEATKRLAEQVDAVAWSSTVWVGVYASQ